MRRRLWGLLGFGLALLAVAGCAGDGAGRQAVEVTFETLEYQEAGRLVTIEGYLSPGGEVSQDVLYGRAYYGIRIYPTAAGHVSGEGWGPTVWLAAGAPDAEPAPNEMAYVPGFWEDEDLRLRLADGSYLGVDDPLRFTGTYQPGEYGGSITVQTPGPGLIEAGVG